MYNRSIAALLAGFAALAVAQPLAAVELTLGLGAAYAPDYEGSDDYAAVPLWNIRVGDLYHPDTYLQVAGLGFSSNLLPNPHFRLGLTGAYVADYNDVDDDAVEDVKGTEDAFLIGPTLGYDFLAEPQRAAVLELAVLYDAAHGNGGVVTPRFRVGMPIAEKLRAEGRISSTWASADYMGNRFSVNERDATRSGLDSYDADEGFKDVTIGGSLTWAFLGNWSLTGLAAYSRMLGDAEDSPIVDDAGDANQFRTGLLINYTF